MTGDHDDGPLPVVPSTDGVQLAVLLRGLQWQLDELARDLPAARNLDPARFVGLATALERVATYLKTQSGIESLDSGEPAYVNCGDLPDMVDTARSFLDDVAHELPAGRARVDHVRELADLLLSLAEQLRLRSGINHGDAEQPPSWPA